MGRSIDPELDLYAHLAGLTIADLPPPTVQSACAVILDHFGCAIIGLTLPWTRALLDALDAAGELNPGPASIYGGRGVAPGVAALVNGTATHGLDLDDTHLPTMSHPGAVVIPAAVAAAQLVGADGRALVTAVVAGYEAMGRITRATGLGFGEKGFHATGQVGAMGAAVACSRLLDPAGGDVAGAVGLAASMGGGIKAFSTGAGMVKRLHAGRAAQAGLFAALLQRAGFTGPPRGIAGKFGFAPTYSTGTPRIEELNDQLGRRYVVDEVYLKPYAACGAVHGAVAAASALGPLDAAAIRQVTVGTSRRALDQNRIPEPRDVMAAQYSTEYSVALALLGGADDPRRYLDAETGGDDDVRQVARRVALDVDDEAERVYPDVNAARVDVLLADGSRLSQRAGVSATTSQGWDVAERKFRRITTGLLDPSHQDRLVAAVAALPEGRSIGPCLDAITIDVTAIDALHGRTTA